VKEIVGVGLATVLTPVVPGVLLAVVGVFNSSVASHDFPVAVGAVYIFSLPIVLLFGLPTFLVLRRAAMNRPWLAALIGAVAGVVVGLALIWPARSSMQSDEWLRLALRNVLTLGVVGVASGAAFWLIWTRAKAVPAKPSEG
jgi:hypothetical membrane protein